MAQAPGPTTVRGTGKAPGVLGSKISGGGYPGYVAQIYDRRDSKAAPSSPGKSNLGHARYGHQAVTLSKPPKKGVPPAISALPFGRGDATTPRGSPSRWGPKDQPWAGS